MNQLEDDCKGRIIKVINMSDGQDTVPASAVAVRKREEADPEAPLEGGFGMDISKLTQLLIHHNMLQ